SYTERQASVKLRPDPRRDRVGEVGAGIADAAGRRLALHWSGRYAQLYDLSSTDDEPHVAWNASHLHRSISSTIVVFGCENARGHGTLQVITRGARVLVCRRHPESSHRAATDPSPPWRPTVAGYTITITPNNDETGPLTTIRVDTGSGSARITELTVRAVEGAGLSPQELPVVNLEKLIAALAPPGPAAIAATPHPTAEPPAPAG